MKRSLSLFAAVALGLAAAAQSRADTIPTISYQWVNVVPVDIPASQWVDPTNHAAGTMVDPNGGGVFFFPEPTAGGKYTVNQFTNSAAANIALATSAPQTNPDMILAPAAGYNYSVELEVSRAYTDAQGHAQTATADITFHNLLTGTMRGSYVDSSGVTQSATADLHNSIASIDIAGGTLVSESVVNGTVTVQVGDADVTVNDMVFGKVSPNQQRQGDLSFDITPSASSAISGGGSTPEPSGIVLGCMGLSCIGGVFWRSRRRKTAEALKAAV